MTLVAELDASTMVIDAAESTEGVQELLHDGHRVTTNRTSLERRDIPIDAVEILESSTRS